VGFDGQGGWSPQIFGIRPPNIIISRLPGVFPIGRKYDKIYDNIFFLIKILSYIIPKKSPSCPYCKHFQDFQPTDSFQSFRISEISIAGSDLTIHFQFPF